MQRGGGVGVAESRPRTYRYVNSYSYRPSRARPESQVAIRTNNAFICIEAWLVPRRHGTCTAGCGHERGCTRLPMALINGFRPGVVRVPPRAVQPRVSWSPLGAAVPAAASDSPLVPRASHHTPMHHRLTTTYTSCCLTPHPLPHAPGPQRLQVHDRGGHQVDRRVEQRLVAGRAAAGAVGCGWHSVVSCSPHEHEVTRWCDAVVAKRLSQVYVGLRGLWCGGARVGSCGD